MTKKEKIRKKRKKVLTFELTDGILSKLSARTAQSTTKNPETSRSFS